MMLGNRDRDLEMIEAAVSTAPFVKYTETMNAIRLCREARDARDEAIRLCREARDERDKLTEAARDLVDELDRIDVTSIDQELLRRKTHLTPVGRVAVRLDNLARRVGRGW